MSAEAGAGEVDVTEVIIEPPARATVLAALGAVLLAVAVVLADAGGRLLATPALVLAVAFVLRDRVAGPLLRADAHGIDALEGWRRVSAPWADVERVRAVKDRRAAVLEIDLGHVVVALSRTRMGRHPEDVAKELADLQAASGPPRSG